MVFRPLPRKAGGVRFIRSGFKDGLVQFPEGAPFMEQVKADLFSYPHGDTTDIVDSIALALQQGGYAYDLSSVR
jgi:phage terminase large subunit-like protein